MSEAIEENNVHVGVLMNIFEDQMGMFRYLKTPDIILSLVSSQKLDWMDSYFCHQLNIILNCTYNFRLNMNVAFSKYKYQNMYIRSYTYRISKS